MTETSNVIEVGEINFRLGNRSFLLSPSDDVTAKEVCLILQMILNVLAQKGDVTVNLESFIEKHGLIKHFKENKNESVDIHG